MTRVFYRSIKRNSREPKTTDPFTHEIEIIRLFLFLKTINENSESIPGRVIYFSSFIIFHHRNFTIQEQSKFNFASKFYDKLPFPSV